VNQYAGGFVGYQSEGSIDECWAWHFALASDTTNGTHCGGFIGELFGGTVTNSFSWGNAQANASASSNAGGFAGSIQITGEAIYCYSLGSVNGSVKGGFAGWGINASCANTCYYSTDRSGCSDENGGSIAVATSAFYLQTTFAGWDFAGEATNGTDDYWTFGGLNYGYPYLVHNPTTF